MPQKNTPPPSYILPKNLFFHQTLTLTLTYLTYLSLHASRKPPTIVKSILGPQNTTHPSAQSLGWAPFNGPKGTHRLGELDLAFLLSYAFGMFYSGHIADGTDLRHFLTCGLLLSSVFTIAFGVGYFLNVHIFMYYVGIQVFCGVFQSTGWPAIVAVVGNWFGKSRRGLIMGVWSSHTSVGNIVGSVIASAVLKFGWGWAFFWPGLFVFLIGVVVYLFLVVSPELIGLSIPSEIELNPIVGSGSCSGSGSGSGSDCHDGEHLGLLQSEDVKSLGNVKSVDIEEIDSVDAIGFLDAWRLPGVASFAICLFFSKLVAYTFLYWLPFYIRHTAVAGVHLSHSTAGMLSTIFDIGGVLGGVLAGLISDKLKARAITSVSFLLLSAPALVLYRVYGSSSMIANNILMFLSGSLVNGPYSLITSAVATDLGTQPAIKGNSRALATVTAIIDGTGSIGAAIGPLLVGYISTSGWNTVFAMLIASIFIAALSLIPAVMSELAEWKSRTQTNGIAR